MNDHGVDDTASYTEVPRGDNQDPEGPPDRNDIRPPSLDPSQDSRAAVEQGTAEPDTAGRETTEPDPIDPDTAEHETGEPDTAGLDTTEPDTAEPDTAGQDTAGQDTAGRVTAGRDMAKRGAVVLDALDHGLAVIAGVMVVFVHDVHYLFTFPYWMDEAWVADSTRAPLGQVARLASSTPYGWTLLLRLVPGTGLERQRLVPLAFAGLAVALGYLLGRELRLTRFAAGLLTAAAVLLSPAMLVRDELKQYTAEACAAVLLWLLVARLENAWTRWRLAVLTLTTVLATLFAETAIITGGAAFVCLTVETAIRRQWRRLAEVAVAGAGTLAGYAVIFVVLVKPRVNPQLSSYWTPWYSPSSVSGAASFFWSRLNQIATTVGFPAAPSHSALLLVIPLILAGSGILALVLLRRYALAAMLPVTLIVVMAGSAARQYPFGEQRTSTFWSVMVPVLIAIAVAAATHGLVQLGIWRRISRMKGGVWSRRGLVASAARAAIALTVGTAAIFFYVQAVRPDVNVQLIAHEDVRSQVDYVEAHLRPGDVIIANYGASYGFAYYYSEPATAYPDQPASGTGFIPQYPGNPHVIVISTGYPASVVAALREARAVVAAEPPAPGSPPARGRIWILIQHDHAAEDHTWAVLFLANLHAGGTVIKVHISNLGYQPGYEYVVLYTLPPDTVPPKRAPPEKVPPGKVPPGKVPPAKGRRA
jgi:hypothetical protein